MEHEPGSLITMATLRRAIERGYRAFDFLRGDESYKAHWRAEPAASVELRVAAERPIARLRHRLWLAGSRLKQWTTGS
jgi:CelD/BcsL family acetyltransferase involved in cellulose biosynthesis